MHSRFSSSPTRHQRRPNPSRRSWLAATSSSSGSPLALPGETSSDFKSLVTSAAAAAGSRQQAVNRNRCGARRGIKSNAGLLQGAAAHAPRAGHACSRARGVGAATGCIHHPSSRRSIRRRRGRGHRGIPPCHALDAALRLVVGLAQAAVLEPGLPELPARGAGPAGGPQHLRRDQHVLP
jgi:hypothetical protein